MVGALVAVGVAHEELDVWKEEGDEQEELRDGGGEEAVEDGRRWGCGGWDGTSIVGDGTVVRWL